MLFECETSCFILYWITCLSFFFLFVNQYLSLTRRKLLLIHGSFAFQTFKHSQNTSDLDIGTSIRVWHCRIISEHEEKCRHNRKTCLMSQRLPSWRQKPFCCIVKKEFLRGGQVLWWYSAGRTHSLSTANTETPSSHHHLHCMSAIYLSLISIYLIKIIETFK